MSENLGNIFEAAGIELPEEENENTCAADAGEGQESQNKKGNKSNNKNNKKNNNSGSNSTNSKKGKNNNKEPKKDKPRLVYLTQEGEQRDFEANYTLEDMRKEIEKDFPAYTQQLTTWWVEEQEERYLCVASYKMNKAG